MTHYHFMSWLWPSSGERKKSCGFSYREILVCSLHRVVKVTTLPREYTWSHRVRRSTCCLSAVSQALLSFPLQTDLEQSLFTPSSTCLHRMCPCVFGNICPTEFRGSFAVIKHCSPSEVGQTLMRVLAWTGYELWQSTFEIKSKCLHSTSSFKWEYKHWITKGILIPFGKTEVWC